MVQCGCVWWKVESGAVVVLVVVCGGGVCVARSGLYERAFSETRVPESSSDLVRGLRECLCACVCGVWWSWSVVLCGA